MAGDQGDEADRRPDEADRGPDEAGRPDEVGRPIEVVAAEWLAAERTLIARDTPQAEAAARDLADEYESAIRAATQEEMRFAWEASRATQANCEMGSSDWADARSVSELLRAEYLARTGHT